MKERQLGNNYWMVRTLWVINLKTDKLRLPIQTQTTNLLTNGINAVGTQLADNQNQTANLLTNGINAVDIQLESSQQELTGNSYMNICMNRMLEDSRI